MRAPEPFGRLAQHPRDAALEHTLEIPVLGIRTCFRTNSRLVLGAIEASFNAWRNLALPAIERVPPVSVHILVRDDGGDERGASVAHELDGPRLLIRSPASVGSSDPLRREAWASVSRTLADDTDNFRPAVLEALTLALLTRLDRQPLHAAAIVQEDAVLLLAGRSGAGKSTLAYAAARAGLQVAGDDMVFVQARPRIRIWTRPAPIRLLPDAAAHFGELANRAPVLLPNGKAKIMVDGASTVAGAVFDRCALCVLGERLPVPALRRLDAAELAAAIDLEAEAGFDVFASSLAPVLQSLGRAGGWMLNPGPDPDAALPLLRAVLAGLVAAPVPA